jgi:hypothetical protein
VSDALLIALAVSVPPVIGLAVALARRPWWWAAAGGAVWGACAFIAYAASNDVEGQGGVELATVTALLGPPRLSGGMVDRQGAYPAGREGSAGPESRRFRHSSRSAARTCTKPGQEADAVMDATARTGRALRLGNLPRET